MKKHLFIVAFISVILGVISILGHAFADFYIIPEIIQKNPTLYSSLTLSEYQRKYGPVAAFTSTSKDLPSIDIYNFKDDRSIEQIIREEATSKGFSVEKISQNGYDSFVYTSNEPHRGTRNPIEITLFQLKDGTFEKFISYYL